MVALRSKRASSNLACENEGEQERAWSEGGDQSGCCLRWVRVCFQYRQGAAPAADLGAAVLAQLEKGPGLLDEHLKPPAVVAGGRGGEEEAALALAEQTTEEGELDTAARLHSPHCGSRRVHTRRAAEPCRPWAPSFASSACSVAERRIAGVPRRNFKLRATSTTAARAAALEPLRCPLSPASRRPFSEMASSGSCWSAGSGRPGLDPPPAGSLCAAPMPMPCSSPPDPH